MMEPKLTLDTNIITEYWKKQSKMEAIERLITLVKDGQVDLAVTARIQEDIPNAPLRNRINELPDLGIDVEPSVTRVGYWIPGRDLLADKDFVEFAKRMQEKLSKEGQASPDWRDWDHLHAHYLQERDIFLTWDKDILRLAGPLLAEFAIIVMKPEEFLNDP